MHDRWQRQPAELVDAMVEVDAFEVLHHQVGLAGGRRTEIHDGDEMGMPQARGDLGLPAKAGQGFRVRGQLPSHHLHRHALVQAQLNRFVHPAHAALGDKPGDAVRALQRGADQGRLLRAGRLYRGPTPRLDRLRRTVAHDHPQRLRRHCMPRRPAAKKLDARCIIGGLPQGVLRRELRLSAILGDARTVGRPRQIHEAQRHFSRSP